ncbi:MAG: hypothetical protein LBV72_06205 [Tannerella sp.]|jgi:polyhydroxyalkanoate synthesis regulator phasin|nr:hypothetical protein [Tannerella sp.]
MKNLFIALFIMISGATYAQSLQQDLALIQSIFGKEKQELITDYMSLNEEQSTKFWPVYDAYEKERQALVRERLQKISDYAQKYGELTDESAGKIMSAVLDNDEKLVKLEKKYLGKMTKAVDGVVAVRYFQLENYLRNLVFAKIQGDIPGIHEMK